MNALLSEADRLIVQSQQTTSIVTVAYIAALAEDLLIACDDHVLGSEPDAVDEYWGSDDGGEWRVHLRHEVNDVKESVSTRPVDLSLLPIDVGFDLRLHDMLVELPREARTVAYVDGDGDERIAQGDTKTLAAILRSAGYNVLVSR